jgi:hypothetical protein
MNARRYDAVLLDLDGTLLDPRGRLRPSTIEAARAAQASGVRVMVATGRSSLASKTLLDELGLDVPAIVFNGAGLYCPRKDKLLEERILSNRTLARVLAFARERDLLSVVMRAGDKLATEPHDDEERAALGWMSGLVVAPREQLEAAEYVIRVSLLSRAWPTSADFSRALETAVALPCYMTDFPLSWLDGQRASLLHVVDFHPPCRGKAEGLRVLADEYGIPPERVVAVGDATNDIPMFEAAGLSVCMANGMPAARAAAQRVIGGHDTDAIAELLDELFLAPERQRRTA